MSVRLLTVVALVLSMAPVAEAQLREEGPLLCTNGLDDDGDGLFDGADPGCGGTGAAPSGAAPAGAVPGAVPGAVVVQPGAQPPATQVQPMPPGTTTVIPNQVAPVDETLYPQRHASQPLTYAQGMLVPSLGLAVVNSPSIGGLSGTVGFELGAGISYGIFDFWQVSLFPLSFRLAPSVDYLNPAIGSTVQFFHTPAFEMGFSTQLNIPVQGSTTWSLALPLLFHLGRIGRIDFTPIAATLLFFSPDTYVILSAALRLAFQITEYAFIGARTGLNLGPVQYDAGSVPLGFFVGGTIPGFDEGPAAQLDLEFRFPALGNFGPGGSNVQADFFVISLNARFFLYLL